MARVITIKCGFANAYVISDEKGAVLVDTGGAAKVKRLARKIGKAGIDMQQIRLLVLTHGHRDHIAGAKALKQQYGIPIAMHPQELIMPVKKAYRSRGLRGWMLRMISMPGIEKAPDFEPDVQLSDRQSLADYGVDARIVHLPGHTPGSIAVVTNTGEMVIGDTMISLGKPQSAIIYTQGQALRQSMARVRAIQPSRIYPGHGRPFSDTKPSK